MQIKSGKGYIIYQSIVDKEEIIKRCDSLKSASRFAKKNNIDIDYYIFTRRKNPRLSYYNIDSKGKVIKYQYSGNIAINIITKLRCVIKYMMYSNKSEDYEVLREWDNKCADLKSYINEGRINKIYTFKN